MACYDVDIRTLAHGDGMGTLALDNEVMGALAHDDEMGASGHGSGMIVLVHDNMLASSWLHAGLYIEL